MTTWTQEGIGSASYSDAVDSDSGWFLDWFVSGWFGDEWDNGGVGTDAWGNTTPNSAPWTQGGVGPGVWH